MNRRSRTRANGHDRRVWATENRIWATENRMSKVPHTHTSGGVSQHARELRSARSHAGVLDRGPQTLESISTQSERLLDASAVSHWQVGVPNGRQGDPPSLGSEPAPEHRISPWVSSLPSAAGSLSLTPTGHITVVVNETRTVKFVFQAVNFQKI